MNEQSPAFLKKLQEFKASAHEDTKRMLLKIINEAKDNGVLNVNYADSTEKLVNIIFKWMFISGEHVRINYSENTIADLLDDYVLFSDVLINGLILKEER